MHPTRASIFAEVRYYQKFSQEIQARLAQFPEEWAKFQGAFNVSVDKLYRDIQQFERDNIEAFENKVYQFKKIFVKRYRRYFLFGEFIRWSYNKPFGYAGDFKIIDSIYQNKSRTTGFERLWDNYFQQLGIAEAVRERKADLVTTIREFVHKRRNHDLRIMNLACGPAREIKEVLEADRTDSFATAIFDCYDFDTNALDYAKKLLGGANNVSFFQKNAIRLALKKEISREIRREYDLIYSAGLLDYLDENISVRLIRNLSKLLRPGGMMVIANMRDKFSNPSAGWMEWVADWNLIYRTENEFKKIFIDADIKNMQKISIISQESKIIQYCFVEV